MSTSNFKVLTYSLSSKKKKIIIIFRWNFKPSSRTNNSYRRKDGDDNGVRIYQMILNTMQVLPVTDIAHIIQSKPSLKRKPSIDNNVETISKTHKKKTTKPTRSSNRVVTGSVGGPSTSKHSKMMENSMDMI